MASLDELEEKVAELGRQNEILGMENEMLADYLQRDADRMALGEDADESLSDMPSPAGKKLQPSRGGHKGQKRQVGLPTSLTLEEKFRIANQEVEALSRDIDQTKKTSEINLDILRALMEETDIRTAEVKRDAYEFRRDIVVGAENPRTGKTMAEKVLKYMEDKLTQKDMLINKLLMKNQAYKISIKKAENALKTKQASGDDLQYIDFHQLQIENQQFVQRIEEANQELLDLKRRSGRTVKILNNMKKRLSSLTTEAKFLEDEIKERKAMLAKTEHDIVKVVEEKEGARKEHKKLRAQSRQTTEMPQIVDYVSQKAKQFELESQKRNWERKVELAETAAKRIRAALRNGTLQMTG
mmetsp:Transcript_39724/g.127299  ORF Transcript_39724/g.127299 Transcript_39724/m.127299 type:complete len:355 (+) Transcript_39724:118-1182(+)|eukprot:CAMPEP_0177181728 /NCGR_PEP_ID=MMETSP0367-20130122/16087_1 /TAXON_ID=447022 ORGANISM="Scrippsiella hangoei-like, Strain SHHI-4" /NCGR_SAMPLE_ID=MMETSP0367 /ASSEMBLY_ACC=CAM_ASM_000362 /LENGTH=354 /DNA_ID=CAMNT_0018628613 /DNA_START=99 /DNA_END=1163 /DNA_ORIENTATION=+